MASACVNRPGSPPEPFIDLSPACPRISFSREEGPITSSDSDPKLPVDFEFRPDDPITMLPADELFAGGKLLPLLPAAEQPAAAGEICLEEKEEEEEEPIRRSDLSAPSPRAPRCSSRWRELLGLKKQQHQQQLGQKQESKKSVAAAAAAAAASHSKNRSLKQFLHRSVRSSTDPTLNLPLLRDSESESVSRRSLSSSSSSSSGPDHEDLPRHSLDSDKPAPAPAPAPISLTRNPPASRARAASRPRSAAQRTSRSPVRRQADAAAQRCPSIDSPRMNASGRVVFERSSSSPGSFTGGPRVRQRGMERSYSAGIRVAPVLNVPVFGLGQLFKKDREGVVAVAGAAGSSAGITSGGNRIKTERP